MVEYNALRYKFFGEFQKSVVILYKNSVKQTKSCESPITKFNIRRKLINSTPDIV